MDNLQVKLVSTPDAEPDVSNFEVVSTSLPAIEKDQILCESLYLSLDPYMRSQIAGLHTSGAVNPGDVMRGETISRVVESNHESFKIGDIVRCFGGWQKYSVHQANELELINPDIQSRSHALSVLGMTGLTAYAGLIWKAAPKQGDVVLIPAATGGVGSTAGQLAKIHGCRVIGIAGSDEKCQMAVDKFGYDACINRKTEDLNVRLKELCPDGIDIYFDLIGGEMLNTASQHLAIGARVILCGLMADYNSKTRTPGPPPGFWIKSRATVYGLVVYDFEHRRQEFINNCLPYVNDGRLTIQEDVTLGLHQAPEAFCRLMRGENFGKVIVKIN